MLAASFQRSVIIAEFWWPEVARTPKAKAKLLGVLFSGSECGGQGNEFELIPTIKMETRHPVKIYFGHEYAVICYHLSLIHI